MPKPIHFEIPIVEPEKSLQFYTNVFGWEFSKFGEMDYWLTMAGEKDEMGIAGAMIKKTGGEKSQDITSAEEAINTVITINVENIDEIIQKITDNGGKIVNEKNTIPNVGEHIYFQDLDGNLLGVMQSFPDRTM